MPYGEGSVWHKSPLKSREIWDVAQKYGIRTPPFMPYEPFLLGVGLVFNVLKLGKRVVSKRVALAHVRLYQKSGTRVHLDVPRYQNRIEGTFAKTLFSNRPCVSSRLLNCDLWYHLKTPQNN